jgi:hypothetical protein
VVNPELWILETAFHALLPFGMLTYREMEYLHNKPSHGLAPDALADLLERLLWQGDIFVEDHEGQRRLFSVAELRELLRVGTRDRDAAYGLTEKGGARWEIEAHVDWSRYVQDHDLEERDEPRVREIVSVDRDRLETYVSRGTVELGDPTDPGSETRDVLTPWRPTYWKTLPVGHRLRCRPSERRFQGGEPGAWVRWDPWLAWYQGADGRPSR